MANLTSPDQDIEVFRGDSATVTFALTRPDSSGNPEDFPIADTTHEMWFTVKSDPAADDSQAEIRKRMGAGDMAVRPAPDDDIVDVVIAAGETAVLAPGRYFYDAQMMVKVTGEVKTVAMGRFFVLPDVTRATA